MNAEIKDTPERRPFTCAGDEVRVAAPPTRVTKEKRKVFMQQRASCAAVMCMEQMDTEGRDDLLGLHFRSAYINQGKASVVDHPAGIHAPHLSFNCSWALRTEQEPKFGCILRNICRV